MNPTKNSLNVVAQLLRQRIGLNADSVGPRLVSDAVTWRMSQCRISDISEYVARLGSDECELSELIEQVIVPESWFFREVAPFECLLDFVRRRRERTSSGRIRLLSIPCSCGEEPYSIAMTLLEAGLQPDQFEVHGIDLSRRSLDRARAGRFRAAAFREQHPWCAKLQQRYFREQAGEFLLDPQVCAAVAFDQGNLVVNDFLRNQAPFDVIFCRNLIIYLTTDARGKALSNLSRLLVPGGLFYVGHTESRLVSEFGFVSWQSNYPSAFTRLEGQSHAAGAHESLPHFSTPFVFSAIASPPVSSVAPGSVATSAAATAESVPKRPAWTPIEFPKELTPLAGARSPVVTVDKLRQARELADSGNLEQAASLCDQLIRESPPTAELFCLAGVIRQAKGDDADAERCFTRALYIDPNHRESLVHMRLLCRRRGDLVGADNFGRRAQRSQGGS